MNATNALRDAMLAHFRRLAPSTLCDRNVLRRTAFTLTELLVCIAIIGILAALIFPIIGRVKGNALKVQCSSNLRQCGTGIQLYAIDNRGFAPSNGWTSAIQPYLSGTAVINYANIQSKFPTSCPSLPYDDSVYGRSTYSLNSWLDTDHNNKNADGTYTWIMPLRNVEAPSRKIMLFDGILASSDGGVNANSNWAYNAVKGLHFIDFRHSGSVANILFVDGHVAALKSADIYDEMWDWQGGGVKATP